jgi:ketosteroid isomerase-like protein
MNYDEYIAVFNTGDDAALVERFFADDVVFTGGTREHRGKAALLDFLRWAHDGVREVMRPQSVCRDDRRIFVEVDMDFHASKVRDDFPFGALRPGDGVTVKFFVTYDLDAHGRIIRLQSMTWAPERGVSKIPKLGRHPSQLAAYGAYAAAFSAGEHARYRRFYTEDVRLELGSVPTMFGADAIVEFYTAMFRQVRETLTIHSMLADDHAIFVDTTSRFTAIADAPDFVVGPLRAGEYIEVRVFVFYTLRGGLISNIKVARAGSPVKSGQAPRAAGGAITGTSRCES